MSIGGEEETGDRRQNSGAGNPRLKTWARWNPVTVQNIKRTQHGSIAGFALFIAKRMECDRLAGAFGARPSRFRQVSCFFDRSALLVPQRRQAGRTPYASRGQKSSCTLTLSILKE